MTMHLYDISRPLRKGMAVWPGDTAFDLQTTASLAAGDTVNLSTLTLSAHTGTHVDAPFHFSNGGPTLEQADLSAYWGPAQVVTIRKESGPLVPADFAGYELGQAPRLLVHSAASAGDPTRFDPDFIFPSPELADYLGGLGIVLYGTDAPSVDASDSKTLPGHHALQRNGILILEGLDLSGVRDGLYELAAFPLKLVGGDGSPVRAVLRAI